jgi:hypothetical protein
MTVDTPIRMEPQLKALNRNAHHFYSYGFILGFQETGALTGIKLRASGSRRVSLSFDMVVILSARY